MELGHLRWNEWREERVFGGMPGGGVGDGILMEELEVGEPLADGRAVMVSADVVVKLKKQSAAACYSGAWVTLFLFAVPRVELGILGIRAGLQRSFPAAFPFERIRYCGPVPDGVAVVLGTAQGSVRCSEPFRLRCDAEYRWEGDPSGIKDRVVACVVFSVRGGQGVLNLGTVVREVTVGV